MKNLAHSLLALSALALAGCGGHDHAGHDHGAHDHGGHGHVHTAPHGGALVVLGDEAAHLEFVLDAATGRLDAYVLDAHASEFVRVAQPALELEVARDGARSALALAAVANPATGETVGATSQFSTVAPALVGATRFDAVVKTITVSDATFTDVAFSFPEGSEGH